LTESMLLQIQEFRVYDAYVLPVAEYLGRFKKPLFHDQNIIRGSSQLFLLHNRLLSMQAYKYLRAWISQMAMIPERMPYSHEYPAVLFTALPWTHGWDHVNQTTSPCKTKSYHTSPRSVHRHLYLDPYNALYKELCDSSSYANQATWSEERKREWFKQGRPCDQLIVLHVVPETAALLLASYEQPESIYDEAIGRMKAPFALHHHFISNHLMTLLPMSKPSGILSPHNDFAPETVDIVEYVTEAVYH